MSGSSKWSNIKRRKGAQDARRSQLFSRLSRELVTAARDGGSDPASNARLRLAIRTARSHNMPRERIERALDTSRAASTIARTFEAYSAQGIALIIETETDNLNRTVGQVRSTLRRQGGSLETSGSLKAIFRTEGRVVLSAAPGDDLLLDLIDAGVTEEQGLTLCCPPEALGAVCAALEAAGVVPVSAGRVRAVQIPRVVSAEAHASLGRLRGALEALDDVVQVVDNAAASK